MSGAPPAYTEREPRVFSGCRAGRNRFEWLPRACAGDWAQPIWRRNEFVHIPAQPGFCGGIGAPRRGFSGFRLLGALAIGAEEETVQVEAERVGRGPNDAGNPHSPVQFDSLSSAASLSG